MSDIVQITDYSTNLELILAQYSNSENLKAIIDSANDSADDIEAAIFEIRDLFYLSTATGIQLDVIGEIFNIFRDGRNDTDYRLAIQLWASFITSGEPEAIIRAMKEIYGATSVLYIPSYPAIPAGFYLVTDAVVTQEQLERISPSGVQPYNIFPLEFQDGTPIEFQDGSNLYATQI